MALNSIWNNKPKGLFSCFCLGIKVIYQKVANNITSLLFCKGIASCGKNVHVNKGVVYRYPGLIHFENDIYIGKNAVFSTEALPGSELKLENSVSIGGDCYIDFSGGVTIKKGAHLAHNVRIITHDHGYNHNNAPVGKSLNIGQNVFIGSNVIILFNCNRIGKNAVVGMGSIVTRDVPDNAIVAGNPAKIIKYRNNI